MYTGDNPTEDPKSDKRVALFWIDVFFVWNIFFVDTLLALLEIFWDRTELIKKSRKNITKFDLFKLEFFRWLKQFIDVCILIINLVYYVGFEEVGFIRILRIIKLVSFFYEIP